MQSYAIPTQEPLPFKEPILVIDEDEDDVFFLEKVFRDLDIHLPLVCFTDTGQALDYLKTTADKPFLILCGANLTQSYGLDFKKSIDQDACLRTKGIPFVFLCSTFHPQLAVDAYLQTTIQGIFVKPGSYDQLKEVIATIYQYWSRCVHPKAKTV